VKPLVGSKGEALVGAADCCKGIIFSNFVENGALNSTLNCHIYYRGLLFANGVTVPSSPFLIAAAFCFLKTTITGSVGLLRMF
jgi:hypothetical protein